MPLLSSTTRRQGASAPALPINSPTFREAGLTLRQGQFSLLASAPSVGKSTLARNLVCRTQIPSLYLSADSDEHTVRTQVLGILTGKPLSEIDAVIESPQWADWFAQELSKVDHVRWSFSPDINIQRVLDRMNAYLVMYGDYPRLTIIDNIGDMVTAEGNEYDELREITRELRKFARYTGSHIQALAHLKGEWEDGTKPVTLKALLGNLGKTPEIVVGLNWGYDQAKEVYLTTPKNRGGRRGVSVRVPVDYETGRLGAFE